MTQLFFAERVRKALVRWAWFVGAAAILPVTAYANSNCIWERDIDHTEVVDDSTILFHMHGHKTWKNTLQVQCFGLKHEQDGFTYQPTDPGTQELCSNQVTIHLNSFKTNCQLGDFTQGSVSPHRY